MKIIRTASDGKIIISLKTNNRTGEFEAKIVEHTGTAKCSDGLDDALLRDILEAEITGFGDMANVTDGGKTEEWFAEKLKGKGKPVVTNPVQAPFPEEEEETKSKSRKLDLGFGV